MFRRRSLLVPMLAAALTAACAPGQAGTATPEPVAASAPSPQPSTPAARPAGDSAAAPAALSDSASALEFGRQVTWWFWTIEADSLMAHVGPQLRSGLVSPNNLAEQIWGLVNQLGEESAVLDETLVRSADGWEYRRKSRLDGADSPFMFVWSYGRDAMLTNVAIQPAD